MEDLPAHGNAVDVHQQRQSDRLRLVLRKYLDMFATLHDGVYFLPFHIDWTDLLRVLVRMLKESESGSGSAGLPPPSYSTFLNLVSEFHIKKLDPGEHDTCSVCAMLHRLPMNSDEFKSQFEAHKAAVRFDYQFEQALYQQAIEQKGSIICYKVDHASDRRVPRPYPKVCALLSLAWHSHVLKMLLSR